MQAYFKFIKITMHKNIDQVSIIVEKSEDGYWVTIEDLPGCFSFGKTVQEALLNTREAIADHIEDMKEKEDNFPDVFKSLFEFQVKYDLQSLFDKYQIINKSAFAEFAGINASLLRQYAKGLAFASDKQRERIECALHRIGEELMHVQL
jgi:predicted RNase H-like HicB family nuclease